MVEITTQRQVIEGYPVVACCLDGTTLRRPLNANLAHIELITYPNCGHETPPAMYAQALRWLQIYL